jgi:hypothetical protein
LWPIFQSSKKIEDIVHVSDAKSLRIDRFFNQVWYQFTLRNLRWSTNLYFSQKRDPSWYLSLDYMKEWMKKNICNWVGESFKSVEFLNAWEISKDKIMDYIDSCYGKNLISAWYPKKLSNGDIDYKYYILHADGSIDITLTLYFRPQLYYFYGIFISAGFFLLVIFFYLERCIYSLIDRKFHPKKYEAV